VVSDGWIGEDNAAVLVVGPDHLRHLSEAGWSKTDLRNHLWPRFFENGRNVVGLGRPEGLLIVAAGGPGLAESWILFPQLAQAITQKVEAKGLIHG
jgi:hypothetical protein